MPRPKRFPWTRKAAWIGASVLLVAIGASFLTDVLGPVPPAAPTSKPTTDANAVAKTTSPTVSAVPAAGLLPATPSPSSSPHEVVALNNLTRLGRIAELQTAGSVTDLAFSPDGALLATALDNNAVQIWSREDWSLKHALSSAPGRIQDLGFQGNRLVVTGCNTNACDTTGSIMYWTLEGEPSLENLTVPHPVLTVPRDNTAVVADFLGFFACTVQSGKTGVCGKWEIQHWSIPNSAPFQAGILGIFSPGIGIPRLPPATFSSDGHLFAVGFGSQVFTQQVEDAAARNVLSWHPGSSYNDIAFSVDGRFLAVSDWRSINVWSVPDWKELGEFDASRSGGAFEPVFSLDGSLLIAAEDAWRTDTWDRVETRQLREISAEPGAMAIAADGTMIAAALRDQLSIWAVSR